MHSEDTVICPFDHDMCCLPVGVGCPSKGQQGPTRLSHRVIAVTWNGVPLRPRFVVAQPRKRTALWPQLAHYTYLLHDCAPKEMLPPGGLCMLPTQIKWQHLDAQLSSS